MTRISILELLRARLVRLAGDRVTAGLGWYGVAELGIRVATLLSTIILARLLVPEDFGVAATCLVTFEIVRTLSRNGVAQMVARATPDTVDAACVTARRVAWATAVTLVVLQLLIGAWLAAHLNRPVVFDMLAVLSLNYLFLPFYELSYARLVRSNRIKQLAGITSAQIMADGLLTASLALSGFGPWAIVLPKLLTTPIYVYLLRSAESAAAPCGIKGLPWRNVVAFALPALGSELIAAARINLDKVLVGFVLGIEALGIYTFVFNAGLGISTSLTNALSATLYPHFAQVANDPAALRQRLSTAFTSSVPLIALLIAAQAAAALIYVPIVFGERWAAVAPLVAILCASAVARPCFDAVNQALRARGETLVELIGVSIFTACLLASFAAALPLGLSSAIAVYAGVSLIGFATYAAVTWTWHMSEPPLPLGASP